MKKANPYETRINYARTKGAFISLISTAKVGWDIKFSQARTFAIRADFPWLNFSPFFEGSIETQEIYLKRQRENKIEGVTLHLPSESVLSASRLSASAAEGGGYHEAGHGICDLAGESLPSLSEWQEKVGKHISLPLNTYVKANLKQMINLLADIRLENGMVLEFPQIQNKFHAVQSWVHKLEEGVRGKSADSDFKMALRDKGKGWVNEEASKVYSEYCQEARDLVDELEPIWSVLIPTNTDWKSTAHLPLLQAILLIEALHKMNGDQGEGDQDDQDDQDDQGGGDQGEGDQGGGDQGNGDNQGGDDQDGGGGQDEGGLGAGKDEMIKDLLEGKGEYLDPMSAMKKQVEILEEQLGHKIYTPHGEWDEDRKLEL